jgi:hypothetical protein
MIHMGPWDIEVVKNIEKYSWNKNTAVKKITWTTQTQLQIYYDHAYETTEICCEYNKMERFKYILQLTQLM